MIYSLTGLMGAGKTTFGFELSRYLNYNFIDTDRYIEENENNTISHIFDKYGENYFRELEKYYLDKIIDDNINKNLVLATGGGIVINNKNREKLRNFTKVIFLNTDINLIKLRLIKEKDKRPLLRSDNWEEKLENIMNARYELYISTSNIILDIIDDDCMKYIKNLD